MRQAARKVKCRPQMLDLKALVSRLPRKGPKKAQNSPGKAGRTEAQRVRGPRAGGVWMHWFRNGAPKKFCNLEIFGKLPANYVLIRGKLLANYGDREAGALV